MTWLFLLQTLGFVGLRLRDGASLVEALGLAVVAAIAIGLVTPLARHRGATVLGAALAAAVMLAFEMSGVLERDGFAPALGPVAHAIRFTLPAAIAVRAAGSSARLEHWLLRASAAAVFAGHGAECLLGHPGFLAFLIEVPRALLGLVGVEAALAPETARTVLTVIGVQDVLLAAFLLWRADPRVGGYMTFWGGMTAFVRVLFYGPAGWAETLVRVGNPGAPWWTLRTRGAGAERRAAPR